MFERFTESVRQAIFAALRVAHEAESAFIETDHLLAGLLRADAVLAQRYPGLAEFASPPPSARAAWPPTLEPRRELPLSHEASCALAYAAEESEQLGRPHIGVDHLLLGLLRDEDSRAALAIRQAGLDSSQMRTDIARQAQAQVAKQDLLRLIDELAPNFWGAAARALHAVNKQGSVTVVRGRVKPPTAAELARGKVERYTEQVRVSIFHARYEASHFGSPFIESEHLLLGLWRQPCGILLHRSGQTALDEIRKEIKRRKPPGDKAPTSVDVPLSDECKRVLLFAAEEANRLKHRRIGDGHLLVGLLREEKSLAAEVLRAHEITLDAARKDLEEEEGKS